MNYVSNSKYMWVFEEVRFWTFLFHICSVHASNILTPTENCVLFSWRTNSVFSVINSNKKNVWMMNPQQVISVEGIDNLIINNLFVWICKNIILTFNKLYISVLRKKYLCILLRYIFLFFINCLILSCLNLIHMHVSY